MLPFLKELKDEYSILWMFQTNCGFGASPCRRLAVRFVYHSLYSVRQEIDLIYEKGYNVLRRAVICQTISCCCHLFFKIRLLLCPRIRVYIQYTSVSMSSVL